MHNLFGLHRNLLDTTPESYQIYLYKEYRDKTSCWCGITPAMFTPYLQSAMHKFLGIDSYEEWKKKRDDHNEFIINCRLAPVGVESPDPPSPFTPVARPVTAPWEIL